MGESERTEMDAFELGWDLGVEGQPLPDLNGAKLLGLEDHEYLNLYEGWRTAIEITTQMIEEANHTRKEKSQ